MNDAKLLKMFNQYRDLSKQIVAEQAEPDGEAHAPTVRQFQRVGRQLRPHIGRLEQLVGEDLSGVRATLDEMEAVYQRRPGLDSPNP